MKRIIKKIYKEEVFNIIDNRIENLNEVINYYLNEKNERINLKIEINKMIDEIEIDPSNLFSNKEKNYYIYLLNDSRNELDNGLSEIEEIINDINLDIHSSIDYKRKMEHNLNVISYAISNMKLNNNSYNDVIEFCNNLCNINSDLINFCNRLKVELYFKYNANKEEISNKLIKYIGNDDIQKIPDKMLLKIIDVEKNIDFLSIEDSKYLRKYLNIIENDNKFYIPDNKKIKNNLIKLHIREISLLKGKKPIEILELSDNIYNVLKQNNIKYIDELLIVDRSSLYELFKDEYNDFINELNNNGYKMLFDCSVDELIDYRKMFNDKSIIQEKIRLNLLEKYKIERENKKKTKQMKKEKMILESRIDFIKSCKEFILSDECKLFNKKEEIKDLNKEIKKIEKKLSLYGD